MDDVSDSDGGVYYSVSLSVSTALVGFPRANNNTGDVLVYEQDRFGEWVRGDNPFVHITNTTKSYFGFSVGIDGDLSCIYDNDKMNLYYRENRFSQS